MKTFHERTKKFKKCLQFAAGKEHWEISPEGEWKDRYNISTSIWPFPNARNHQTRISFIMKYFCDCVIVSIYLCPMICLNLSGKYIVCTVTCVLEVRRLKKKRCQMLTEGCIFSKHASLACLNTFPFSHVKGL